MGTAAGDKQFNRAKDTAERATAVGNAKVLEESHKKQILRLLEAWRTTQELHGMIVNGILISNLEFESAKGKEEKSQVFVHLDTSRQKA